MAVNDGGNFDFDDLFELFLWQENPLAAFMMFLMPDEKESTYDQTCEKFDFEDCPDNLSKEFFRFTKEDIATLSDHFEIPETVILENRCRVKKIDAMCMLLYRLHYPNRLVQMERVFGRPKTTISMTIKTMVDIIFERFRDKLERIDQAWITRRRQMYADAIHAKGAPLDNVFGFIDGTVISICRPGRMQRVVYNGHKRVHALKFQSVVSPDGMIMTMHGPFEGRRHDSALLRQSGLLEQFEAGNWVDRNGTPYALYGDPAYPMRPFLISPYPNPDGDEQEFNRRMSSVREAVEWQFGKILTYFSFLDFRKNLKVLLQPVGKLYLVGALLTNCHTILYGSQVGAYFNVDPPTLDEYLS